MAVFNNILAGASGQSTDTEYSVDRSLRFNSADSAYLSRTLSTAGNRKTWAWSGWVKRSALGVQQSIFGEDSSGTFRFRFGSDDTLQVLDGSNASLANAGTSSVFRDASAWYHIVLTIDTTEVTASDRIKVYVNGIRQPLTYTTTPTLDGNLGVNDTSEHRISNAAGQGYLSCYLADIHFIDGQALDPTSFGEFDDNGIWQPIEYTGGYGLVSVADATGALPIYNTTDAYGTVKGTGTRTDANASSLVLAIPMDGANNGTTFTDESATIKGSGIAKTITRYGDTKTVTSVSKYYGSSGYFDGTGDYLELAASSDFATGTSNFTLECWYYPVSKVTRFPRIFQVGTASWNTNDNWTLLDRQDSANTKFAWACVALGGNAMLMTSTTTVTNNTWYHLAVVRDGSTFRLFVNGVEEDTYSNSGAVTSSASTKAWVAAAAGAGNTFSNGYIQDLRFYKGVAKYTSNFTPVTTNNSFHLPFSDNSSAATLGTDTSGNSNTWTVNNISVAAGAGNDSLVDTPTNYGTDTGAGGEVRGNYATWNPLAIDSAQQTLSQGNLYCSWSSTIGTRPVGSTIAFNSGLWYAELECVATGTSTRVGITDPSNIRPGVGLSTCSYNHDGTKTVNGSTSSYGSSYAGGDIIGIAVNLTTGKAWFSKNGVWQNSGDPVAGTGEAANGLSGSFVFAASELTSTAGCAWTANFGQRPFAYAAPSGYKALCTANLSTPTIEDGSTAVSPILWTGNGGSQTISGLNFAPSFIWHKIRSIAGGHQLYDIVRGVSKRLRSDDVTAETTLNGVTAFNSDGWTMSAGNNSGESYVSWAWDAGSSTVSNTDGSITSSVRVNTSAGFSVVTAGAGGYFGGTVGHGLGVAPDFIILKDRNGTTGWRVYHSSMGDSKYGVLSTTDAFASFPNLWNVSSTTFGSDKSFTNTAVAYCWSAVEGYSDFGTYIGNGSADGPFVYTGFRPRWVLIKCSSSAGSHWLLFDTERSGYNVADDQLYANLSNAEATANSAVDFLSNGFKPRADTFGNINGSGGTYIYAAFAEHPFKTARAR